MLLIRPFLCLVAIPSLVGCEAIEGPYTPPSRPYYDQAVDLDLTASRNVWDMIDEVQTPDNQPHVSPAFISSRREIPANVDIEIMPASNVEENPTKIQEEIKNELEALDAEYQRLTKNETNLRTLKTKADELALKVKSLETGNDEDTQTRQLLRRRHQSLRDEILRAYDRIR